MNNINTGELQKFAVAVQENPEAAKKHKVVAGSWVFEEGQPQFAATVEFAQGNLTLQSELPAFAGGWGMRPDPIQYCLYGVAACFAVTFMAVATSEGTELSSLRVTVENWMDLRKQLGFGDSDIVEKVKITVQADGPARETLARLVRLAEERCPGTECLTRPIPVTVELS